MQNEKKPVIKAIDFFCGAGGVTRGLLNSGIDVICGIDIDNKFCLTYEENNIRPNGKKVEFIQKDINELTYSELSSRLTKEKFDKLIFVGCAPCQPFTNLNTNKEKRIKERNYLLRFAQFISHFKPDYLFVENVPGITAKKYGGVLGQFKEILKDNGYNYLDKNINAKYYGVPQNRNRRILIASLKNNITFPEETHGKGKKDFLTVLDVFKKYNLKPLKAGETDPNDPLHKAANLSETNLWRIKHTSKDGGGRDEWMKIKPLKCYQKLTNAYKDVYNRMYWNKPSPTITTRFNSLSNGRFGHPEEDRAISFREGALLQTFPYNYKFYGSNQEIARCIGNAVPVKLAEIFGTHFIKFANEER
jgi:DNA (cytosine-5)-methyltransferase 1